MGCALGLAGLIGWVRYAEDTHLFMKRMRAFEVYVCVYYRDQQVGSLVFTLSVRNSSYQAKSPRSVMGDRPT